MILLGLILIIAAVGVAGWLYTSTESMSDRSDLDAFNVAVGMTPLQLVIAGAVVVLLLWLGVALVRRGTVRSTRRRRDRKEEARRAEEERLLAEREAEEKLREQRLATETARERAAAAEGEVESLRREHGDTTPPDPGDGRGSTHAGEGEPRPVDDSSAEASGSVPRERTADDPADVPPRDRA